jgi:hypothetical protein
MALLALIAIAALPFIACAAPPLGGVLVRETDGSMVDSTGVVAAYGFGQLSGVPKSFALSDTGPFGRLAWGIGDYATQGSLIAEKLLSLGSPHTAAVVRGWLARVPVNDDGKAWGTELGEFHGGGQGAYEVSDHTRRVWRV